MAKFIILFFFTIGLWITYLTYNGTGQEVIKTLKQEEKSPSSQSSSVSSSSSSRNSRSNSHFSSYNSSSYGYGK